MRELTTCTACQRPHRANETACPFCGAAVPAGQRGSGLVRKLKMGGLLAFTAVAAQACYGSPPPRMLPVGGPDNAATTDVPQRKVPTKAGTAYVHITPKGGKTSSTTVALAAASLIDALLSVKSADGLYQLSVRSAAAADYEAKDGVWPPIDAAKLQSFTLTTPELNAATPAKAVTGTLQLSKLDAKTIGGTLLVEVDDKTVAIYFLANRN